MNSYKTISNLINVTFKSINIFSIFNIVNNLGYNSILVF